MSTLQEYRISEIAEVIGGGTPDTKDESLWNGDIAWITPADLSRNKEKYFKIGERSITQKGLKESSTRLLPKGTVLLSSRAPIGYLAIAANSICTNQGFKSLVCYADIVSNEYLYYYLLLQRDYLETISSGATFPELSGGTLKKLKILLPPIPTQQRIASILSAYDDLIEVNNQRIKLLEETARELYKEWFVRMRFPATAGRPGYKQAKIVKGVPEGWTFDTCYSFADVKGGGTPSTINPQYWEGEINFFTPTDHSNSFYIFETEKKITEKGLKNSSTKMFSKYSTFITARGTVGNICLAGNDMAMNQSCFGIVSHNPIDCFFTFLFTDEMIRYLKLVASGATFDAITLNTFKNYKAPIPNCELREKYFELASPMFFQIENLIQQNTQLRQIRDRLLPRLISGKLEVNEK